MDQKPSGSSGFAVGGSQELGASGFVHIRSPPIPGLNTDVPKESTGNLSEIKGNTKITTHFCFEASHLRKTETIEGSSGRPGSRRD